MKLGNKRAHRKLMRYFKTTQVFVDQKRMNICEHTVKMVQMTVLSKNRQGKERE